MQKAILQLAQSVGEKLFASKRKIVTAESCTGGALAAALTLIPAASRWFDQGFVTYSYQAKHEMLGVSLRLLEEHGAVSEPVAKAMALGALAHSHSDIAISITGIAGPGGGSEDKPIGLVWIGLGFRNGSILTRQFNFAGERAAVREQTIMAALEWVLESD